VVAELLSAAVTRADWSSRLSLCGRTPRSDSAGPGVPDGSGLPRADPARSEATWLARRDVAPLLRAGHPARALGGVEAPARASTSSSTTGGLGAPRQVAGRGGRVRARGRSRDAGRRRIDRRPGHRGVDHVGGPRRVRQLRPARPLPGWPPTCRRRPIPDRGHWMPEQLLDSSEVDVLPDEDARKGMTECVPGAVGDACSGQGTQV